MSVTKLLGPGSLYADPMFADPLKGDFTLDCYIGNKMARKRGGRYNTCNDRRYWSCPPPRIS